MKWRILEGLLIALIAATILCLTVDDLLRIRVLKPGAICPICHQVVEETP